MDTVGVKGGGENARTRSYQVPPALYPETREPPLVHFVVYRKVDTTVPNLFSVDRVTYEE